jgi:UDP-perosamine 4-acetyltransferase
VRLLVVGAGGHAKVVIDTARRSGWAIAAVVGVPGDPDEIAGCPVVLNAEGVEADAFIIAIGDNRTRSEYYRRYVDRGMTAATVVDPSATISESVRIGDGTLVVAGAIVNIDTHIGENVICNTGCMIDHDCIIGDHALVGPGCTLCGAVEIGEGTLLGAGVNVIPQASVGDWSRIGAGATVVDRIPSHVLCVGVPARAIRTIEE